MNKKQLQQKAFKEYTEKCEPFHNTFTEACRVAKTEHDRLTAVMAYLKDTCQFYDKYYSYLDSIDCDNFAQEDK
jgi:hypothetical protein